MKNDAALRSPVFRPVDSGVCRRGGATPFSRLGLLPGLAFVIVYVVTLYQLRQIAVAVDRPPPAPFLPLEFRLIQERYWQVQTYDTYEEVETWLGPPTERNVCEPVFGELERLWLNGGRNWFPKDRCWHKWSDPNDKRRWVAVCFYRGLQGEPKVYRIIKKGF
jgi:hypothetical protein